MQIKLISVDVWNTLLKSNPNSSLERSRRLIMGMHNRQASLKEVNHINMIYRSLDVDFMAYEVRTGITIPTKRRHQIVLEKLGYSSSIVDEDFYRKGIMEDNYYLHKPVLVNPITIPLIKRWSSVLDRKVLILCNTGYASGKVVENILNYYSLKDEIQFIGSDQVHICKPNLNFYKNAYAEMPMYNTLHIGDSLDLDINPVKCIGGHTHQISKDSDWNNIEKLLWRE